MSEKGVKSRRQLKKEVVALLEQEWAEKKEKILEYPLKSLLNPLFIALCHPEKHVRQNAVEGFAMVVPLLAKYQREDARVVMRRFLWSLNDESGGIGWGAPEAMAAIMCESELLRKEYLHMLISYMRDDGPELFQDGNFLELPMLQRGLLWGIGLLCYCFPELMKASGVEQDLLFYLDSDDVCVAGAALLSLSYLGCRVEETKLERFYAEQEVIDCYEEGMHGEYSIADIARRFSPAG